MILYSLYAKKIIVNLVSLACGCNPNRVGIETVVREGKASKETVIKKNNLT